MEFISSDTNIWLDFHTICKLELPFKLPYNYVMFREALREEVISPPDLLDELKKLGIIGVELTTEEFYYAMDLANKYVKLSNYDRIALAIAKYRGFRLLTGDKALRSAAEKEEVHYFGTIGLLDELYNGKHISRQEYKYCLNSFIEHAERRLPPDEIQKRLNELNKN